MGAALQVVNHLLAVTLLIVVGPGIGVTHAESQRFVEKYRQLSRRGGNRLCLARSGGQPPIEGAQRRLSLADVNGGDAQYRGCAIGGPAGSGAEQAPA